VLFDGKNRETDEFCHSSPNSLYYLTFLPISDTITRMLKIRLQRVGRENIPVFRVVLTDSKNSTKSGRFLEILGMFDPVKNVKEMDSERIKYWISKGAKLTDTLHNHLVGKKIISGVKINKLPKKRPIVKEVKEVKEAAPAKPEAVSESAPVQA
jgi:small subunit ribosomal protein S16